MYKWRASDWEFFWQMKDFKRMQCAATKPIKAPAMIYLAARSLQFQMNLNRPRFKVLGAPDASDGLSPIGRHELRAPPILPDINPKFEDGGRRSLGAADVVCRFWRNWRSSIRGIGALTEKMKDADRLEAAAPTSS